LGVLAPLQQLGAAALSPPASDRQLGDRRNTGVVQSKPTMQGDPGT
jgi:hypothetical protein